MKNFTDYMPGIGYVLVKQLKNIWRHAMVLMALFALAGTNAFANTAAVTEFPCTGPCENLRTQTMGGWGATPSGTNPAKYLLDNFSVFGSTGVVVGGNGGPFSLTLTSAEAVNRFLPSGSTARALDKNYTNPTNASESVKGRPVYENVLAGQAVALTISIAFDDADVNFAPSTTSLKHAVIGAGDFKGLTVAQVLAEANKFLSGQGSSYTASQLNIALSNINESFVDGKANGKNFLICEFPKPEVTLTADHPVCGEDTRITAKPLGGRGPYTYAWSVPAPATNPGNVASFTTKITGTYMVTVTDARGCKASDKIYADVWENPAVEITAAPACDGPTTLTATASGGKEPYSYTWTGPGGATIVDADNVIEVTAGGTYSVTVTDANGCEGEATIESVKIYVRPTLVVERPNEICIGYTFDLFSAIINISEGAQITYWNGAIELSEDAASAVGPGTYTIKATFTYDEVHCSVEQTVVVEDKVCDDGGSEGCTLGYWKNHTNRWCEAYTPSTRFGDVFNNAPANLADLTLLQALNLGGGTIYNLARQGVAALLNACSGQVEYGIASPEAVIIRVNAAYADGATTAGNEADYLDGLNNAGCPLGGSKATTSLGGATSFSLLQGINTLDSNSITAYPTPFSDKATIEFTVAADENFVVNLYDLKGALIKQLKAGTAKAGEVNQVEVDGRNLSEGIYLARMLSDSGVRTVKLLLKK